MTDCTIHLLTLHAGASEAAFIDQVATSTSILVKGKPHGWVQEPRDLNRQQLVDNQWDLLLLTTPTTKTLSESAENLATAHISVPVSVPDAQFSQLKARLGSKPTISSDTPPLPTEWSHGSIPSKMMVETKNAPLKPGELSLDANMSDFLSNALPTKVVHEPACFFNFFRYANGDRSVHDAYMQGFKDNFGSAAGASLLFMGPVKEPLHFVCSEHEVSNRRQQWDDANLVQYDSVWHYAYMLSTDVYKELNKQKVEGLEDTCILLVSEIELFDKA